MRCAVHSDVDAVGYCRNCGRAMCATCVRPVRDVLYCEECLANIVGIPAPAPARYECGSGIAIPDARFWFAWGITELHEIESSLGFPPGISAGDGRLL